MDPADSGKPGTLPKDPDHEIFHKIHDNTLPPKEAFRLFLKGEEVRNKQQRFIYSGNIPFDADEEKALRDLDVYMECNEKYKVIPDG